MALVGGVTVTTGNTVHLSYYDAPRIKGGFDHTPIFYIFPHTDYLFIVGIVMSLLALMFSYDAISGERERGSVMGTFQSAASLARVVGPIVAGMVYEIAPGWPFRLASVLLVFALALAATLAATETAPPTEPKSTSSPAPRSIMAGRTALLTFTVPP